MLSERWSLIERQSNLLSSGRNFLAQTPPRSFGGDRRERPPSSTLSSLTGLREENLTIFWEVPPSDYNTETDVRCEVISVAPLEIYIVVLKCRFLNNFLKNTWLKNAVHIISVHLLKKIQLTFSSLLSEKTSLSQFGRDLPSPRLSIEFLVPSQPSVSVTSQKVKQKTTSALFLAKLGLFSG